MGVGVGVGGGGASERCRAAVITQSSGSSKSTEGVLAQREPVAQTAKKKVERKECRIKKKSRKRKKQNEIEGETQTPKY